MQDDTSIWHTFEAPMPSIVLSGARLDHIKVTEAEAEARAADYITDILAREEMSVWSGLPAEQRAHCSHTQTLFTHSNSVSLQNMRRHKSAGTLL